MFRKNMFHYAMGAAVQAKRLVTGTLGETKYTRFLESIQYVSQDEQKDVQAQRLCRILRHAVANVPFYKALENELELTKRTVFDDIHAFPVIDKTIIQNRYGDFIDKDSPYSYKMKTGGTSKIKLEVLRDRFSSTERNDEFFNRIMDVYPGRSRLDFATLERDYRADRDEYTDYHINGFTRSYMSRPLPLTEEKLAKTYEMCMRYRPELIRGNAYAITRLSEYIIENNLKKPPVDLIMSSAVRLIPYYKKKITEAFNASIFDTYGATEINYVAAQCREHKHMHYVPATTYLECVGDDRNVVGAGEPGSLTVTSTSHFAMPVIRYEIGDLATLTDEQCSCGRTFPSIREIHGRTMEKIETPGGSINIIELNELMSRYGNVADFQVIQRKEKLLEVSLAIYNDSGNAAAFDEIKGGISSKVGNSVEVVTRVVDRPEQEDSGKIIRLMPYEYYKKRDRREADLC